ncbi:hypothetical protein ACGFX2_39880 [Streptomyces goshikiensis]|uniref:hypothetical protein n=1 Tax=Streptomyces goshikiensis TaxID=1942 RepID=UPI00371EBD23
MSKYADGTVKLVVTDMDKAMTADDYHQPRLFVIESALQAARADAAFTKLDAYFPEDVDIEAEEHTWTGPAGSRD